MLSLIYDKIEKYRRDVPHTLGNKTSQLYTESFHKRKTYVGMKNTSIDLIAN